MFDVKDNGYCSLMAFLISWFRPSCVNQGCNYWFLADLVWEVESMVPLIAAVWVFHGLLIRASCLFVQGAYRAGYGYNLRGNWSPVVVQHRRLSGIRDISTSTVSYRFICRIQSIASDSSGSHKALVTNDKQVRYCAGGTIGIWFFID